MKAYSPSDEWHKIKLDLMRKVELIDKNTPWQETEPDWRLNMMAVRELIQTF